MKGQGKAPWWSRGFLFSSAPEGVTAYHWRILAVLGSAYVVNSYDLGILNLALPQIQEGLGISEADVAFTTGLVRFGVLPALILNVMADRIGRRRLLLVTIVGFTACTFMTAFARTPAEFVAAQFLARMFIYSEEMLAIVVVTEELPAQARGWGIGILVALGAMGHGLAALVFAGVEWLPYGWRALYFLGAAPLLLIVWLRRNLQETRRFTEYQATLDPDRPTGFWAAIEPLRHLFQMYPGRMAILAAAYFPFSYFVGTALAFQSKFLQQSHGYSPADVSFLFLIGGVLAVAGGLVGGRASDRFGRRKVLVVGVLLNLVAFAAFYQGAGAVLVVGWILSVFTYFAVDALFAALGSELFPTSYRSTASGVRGIVGAVGSALGLLSEGTLFAWLGSHSAAITAMSSVLLLSPIVVMTLMPETATRELEEIAPEKD
jgi:putative MFS transporter